MNEQKEQDWKEERIAEYAKLETAKQQIQNDMNLDAELNKIETSIKAWLERADRLKKPYFDKTLECEQQQAGIKLELAEKWNIPGKTFGCNAGTATLRTTRSLIIRNKQKLIEFLTLNKKLTEFIKSFEITKLRKIKDAGLLASEIATWDEKRSISISLTKEAEQ